MDQAYQQRIANDKSLYRVRFVSPPRGGTGAPGKHYHLNLHGSNPSVARDAAAPGAHIAPVPGADDTPVSGRDETPVPSSLRLLPSGRKVRVMPGDLPAMDGVCVAVKGAPRRILEKTLWATYPEDPWVCSDDVVVALENAGAYAAPRAGGRPAHLGALHAGGAHAKILNAKALDDSLVRLRLQRALPCMQGLFCRVGAADGVVVLPTVPRGDIRPRKGEQLALYRLRVAGFSYGPDTPEGPGTADTAGTTGTTGTADAAGVAGQGTVVGVMAVDVERMGPWVYNPVAARKMAAALRRAKAAGARVEEAAANLAVEPAFAENVLMHLRPTVSPADAAVLGEVEAVSAPDACFVPPENARLEPILDRLVAMGLIYPVRGPAYVAEARLDELCSRAQRCGSGNEFSENEFRDDLSTSRNRTEALLLLLESRGCVQGVGGGRYTKTASPGVNHHHTSLAKNDV